MKRAPLLPDRARPLIFAHRGCSSLAPENTLASFRLARETGAPGIELDVHLCASGELVVAHDDGFSRTAPEWAAAHGEGAAPKIEQLSREDIRHIDVGSFFDPRFGAERCPLLQDVLEEFCPGLYVDIELKTRKVSGDGLPGAAAALLARMDRKVREAVTVSSFNPFALRGFRAQADRTAASGGARIPLAIIYCVDAEVPWPLQRGAGRLIADADYAKPRYDLAGPAHVTLLSKREKRPVVPWTVDDRVFAAELAGRGCEGIITNCPQNFR